MNKRRILASLVVLAAMASPLSAQQKPKRAPQHPMAAAKPAAQPKPMAAYPDLVQEQPGLLARVTVSADSATHVALKGTVGGAVTSRRLVDRQGKLLYIIRLTPRTGGEKEVMIDATTGMVVPPTSGKPKGS